MERTLRNDFADGCSDDDSNYSYSGGSNSRVKTADLLRELGIGQDVYRSVVVAETVAGFDDLSLAPSPNVKGLREDEALQSILPPKPVYRSVAMGKCNVDRPKAATRWDNSHWLRGKCWTEGSMRATKDQENLAHRIETPMVQAEAPPVQNYPMSANVFDVNKIQSYSELCQLLTSATLSLRILDFHLDNEAGIATGRWWSDTHMANAVFRINIYKKEDGEYKLEFTRQEGSALAFHEILRHARRQIFGHKIPPPLTTPLDQIQELPLSQGDLDGWALTLERGCIEAVRAILPVLSKTSAHNANCSRIALHDRIVDQLLRWGCSSDCKAARYALTTLCNVLELRGGNHPRIQQDYLDQLCQVATQKTARSDEVVFRSLLTMGVLMKNPAGRKLDRTKVCQELQAMRPTLDNSMLRDQVDLLLTA